MTLDNAVVNNLILMTVTIEAIGWVT